MLDSNAWKHLPDCKQNPIYIYIYNFYANNLLSTLFLIYIRTYIYIEREIAREREREREIARERERDSEWERERERDNLTLNDTQRLISHKTPTSQLYTEFLKFFYKNWIISYF